MVKELNQPSKASKSATATKAGPKGGDQASTVVIKAKASGMIEVKVIEHVIKYGAQFGVIVSGAQECPTKLGVSKLVDKISIDSSTSLKDLIILVKSYDSNSGRVWSKTSEFKVFIVTNNSIIFLKKRKGEMIKFTRNVLNS